MLYLSISWDLKGLIYVELLSPHATINAEVYLQQIESLNKALQKTDSF